MEFIIAEAFAQEVNSKEELSNIPSIYFYIASAVFFMIAVFLIIKKLDVSLGHSVIVGCAIAVGMVPYVSEFEWSKDGIKFTTRSQTVELAQKVAGLARKNTELGENLRTTQEALRGLTIRLTALETPTEIPEVGEDVTTGMTINPSQIPRLNTDIQLWDKLITDNSASIRDNQRSLDEIEQFQNKLLLPENQM